MGQMFQANAKQKALTNRKFYVKGGKMETETAFDVEQAHSDLSQFVQHPGGYT